MEFYLSNIPFNPSRSYRFRQKDFDKILGANLVRLSALSAENSFDTLVENYFEFERDCVDVAHRVLVSFCREDIVIHGYQLLLNRRLMNIMTAAKAYQDHLNKCLKEILGEKGKYSKLYNEIWSELNRLSPQFRAMNCLRNYIQHYEFPVHGYSHSIAWNMKGGKKDAMKVNINLRVNVDSLLKDDKFRKDADGDVVSCLRSQSLSSIISTYVENIWSLHSEFRKKTNGFVLSSDAIVNEVFKFFGESFNIENADALAIYKIDDGGRISRQENMFRRVEEIRKHLYNKNSYLGSISRAYVVTKIFDEQESALT